MQLASGSHIPDGLLAANALLSEKLHQGFAAPKITLHQGFGFVISHTSLEISGTLYDTRAGSRCTGKERDTESGLDYFGARYYASNMGRWISPDWNDAPDPLPYAAIDNPQTLNLYAYVMNNPMSSIDDDGHSSDCDHDGDKSVVCLVTSGLDWLKNHLGGGGGGSTPCPSCATSVNITNWNVLPVLTGAGKEALNTVNGLSNFLPRNRNNQLPIFTMDNSGERSGALFAGVGMFFIPGGEEGEAIDAETVLYQKLAADGEHLKYGITDNPFARYTKSEMNGGRLKILARGTRSRMLQLERDLHSTLPLGPEEYDIRHYFTQWEKGYTLPPYQP